MGGEAPSPLPAGPLYADTVFAGLGRLVYRRRLAVAVAWVVVLAAGLGFGS
jgi:hypothetical protein